MWLIYVSDSLDDNSSSAFNKHVNLVTGRMTSFKNRVRIYRKLLPKGGTRKYLNCA